MITHNIIGSEVGLSKAHKRFVCAVREVTSRRPRISSHLVSALVGMGVLVAFAAVVGAVSP